MDTPTSIPQTPSIPATEVKTNVAALQGKVKVKIESPGSKQLNSFYVALLMISFILIGLNMFLLVMEFLNLPLPNYIHQIVNELAGLLG